MTAAGELLRFLQEVQKSTRTGRGREALDAWVGDYYGKIIQFTSGGKSIHAVFTRQGMTIREGQYPSPEVALSGDAVEELARRRFAREAVKEVMKQKRVTVRGNLHEAFALSRLAEAALGGGGK